MGGVWFYESIGRFYNYKVRYEPGPDSADLDLASIGKYEIDRLLHMFGAYSSIHPMGRKTALKIIHLFVPEPNMAQLESHMPQSGFEYVEGGVVVDGVIKKVKVKRCCKSLHIIISSIQYIFMFLEVHSNQDTTVCAKKITHSP